MPTRRGAAHARGSLRRQEEGRSFGHVASCPGAVRVVGRDAGKACGPDTELVVGVRLGACRVHEDVGRSVA